MARKQDEFSLRVTPRPSTAYMPDGVPGMVRINDHDYSLSYLEYLGNQGSGSIRGYRITHQLTGRVYDLAYDLARCSCLGNEVHRRIHGSNCCKHVRAIRQFRDQGKIL